MSINHLIDESGTPKYDIFVKNITAEGTITSTGLVDKTSWVSQVSEANSPAKDLLYDWTNLATGTSRSSYGHFSGVNSRLLLPDATAQLVTVKGTLSTVASAGLVWTFLSPSFEVLTLDAQSIVYEDVVAVDVNTGTEYRGFLTDLNTVPNTVKIIWTNLTPAVGNPLHIRYEYTLCQQVPA